MSGVWDGVPHESDCPVFHLGWPGYRNRERAESRADAVSLMRLPAGMFASE